MFFTFHAAKVQRIFGTAKFLAKKITERTILIKNVQIFCNIFCLSERAVICIVYLAGDTIAALRTSALAMPAAYPHCAPPHWRCPLPIRSASSGVLFVGRCLSGVRAPAYCLLAAAYPECELRRIVCWPLPIRSANSGVLFVGC